MTQIEKLYCLNNMLLDELPQYREEANKFTCNYADQRQLLRSLMNVRRPMSLSDKFLKLQDEFLTYEVKEKGVVSLSELKATKANKQIYLWKGDITTLKVDGIVNAANSALLGCFIPCHRCIDNAIHSVAGLQLRQECHKLMEEQGAPEQTGKAKITKGYNLPAATVIHTVGPIITGKLTSEDCRLLESSYYSCLKIAEDNQLKSVAFCCISTGEFRFPNEKAAEIAVATVTKFMKQNQSKIEVVFNVFTEKDEQIYRKLLGENSSDK